MKRDLETIQNLQFDLLVIGGGIQGAAICYKAAQRGLRVALLEKNDFCGSSSANSLKILHGGLRYLQTLDFRRMRDSIRSRRELMQLAPHLVAALPCAMPAYGHGLKGKESMRVAMAMNDLISIDRNKGLHPEKQLPAGHILSKAQSLRQIPGISEQALHGASVWYDALAINTERLAFEYILKASELGASCVNYLSVRRLSKQADGQIEAQLYDALGEQEISMRAEHVINSAGAAYEDLIPGTQLDKAGVPEAAHWARGLNIVVRKNLFPGGAVALEKKMGATKRMLFMVPWREKYTMIGTHYIEKSRSQALFPIEKEDIMALLNEMNAIYPPAKLRFEDVSFYHAGLLPMQGAGKSDDPLQPALSKESIIFDHGQVDGFEHFYSIRGIKYTTAPQVADKILKRIFGPAKALSEPARPSQAVNDGEHNNYLLKKYADRAAKVAPYVATMARWLDEEHSLLSGEVKYFIEEEMACHLSDVVFRRSELGTAECPSLKALERINQLLADHFQWGDERQAAEIKQVLARYAPLLLSH